MEGNEVLATVLGLLGWTPESLARRVNARAAQHGVRRHVHEKTPYKWLAGDRPRDPVPRLVLLVLNDALRVPITLDDLGWRGPRHTALPFADDGFEHAHDQRGLAAALVRLDWRSLMDRRRFVALSGGALTASVFPAIEPGRAERALAGDRVTPAMVDALDDLSRTLRRADDVGGGTVHDWAVREFAWVSELMNRGTYTEQIAARLHTTLANFAQIAGWSAYDLGNLGLAQRYHLIALRAARLGSDPALPGHVLAMLAYQCRWRGQPRDALALGLRTIELTGGRASPRTLAWLHANRGSIFAANGERVAAELEFDAAWQRLDEHGDQEPDWNYWVCPETIHTEVGNAYDDLGLHDLAADAHARSAAALTAFPRQRVINLCYVARSQAAGGWIDESCATLKQVAIAGEDIPSDRWRQLARDVCGQLAPHRQRPTVRDTLELIHDKTSKKTGETPVSDSFSAVG